MPEVVGFRLTGELQPGATATDLVLFVTQILRNHGVVGRFVEYFGKGLSSLSLPDRATLANMAPEYGATAGLFPIDSETLRYMRVTGRSESLIDLVERYAKEQSLFRTDETPDPVFNDVLELDLAEVVPSVAGPRRPQDRVALGEVQSTFRGSFADQFGSNGHEHSGGVPITIGADNEELHHGSVRSRPLPPALTRPIRGDAGRRSLVAKKAVERGLEPRPMSRRVLRRVRRWSPPCWTGPG